MTPAKRQEKIKQIVEQFLEELQQREGKFSAKKLRIYQRMLFAIGEAFFPKNEANR
jgi:hypothetical protein